MEFSEYKDIPDARQQESELFRGVSLDVEESPVKLNGAELQAAMGAEAATEQPLQTREAPPQLSVSKATGAAAVYGATEARHDGGQPDNDKNGEAAAGPDEPDPDHAHVEHNDDTTAAEPDAASGGSDARDGSGGGGDDNDGGDERDHGEPEEPEDGEGRDVPEAVEREAERVEAVLGLTADIRALAKGPRGSEVRYHEEKWLLDTAARVGVELSSDHWWGDPVVQDRAVIPTTTGVLETTFQAQLYNDTGVGIVREISAAIQRPAVVGALIVDIRARTGHTDERQIGQVDSAPTATVRYYLLDNLTCESEATAEAMNASVGGPVSSLMAKLGFEDFTVPSAPNTKNERFRSTTGPRDLKTVSSYMRERFMGGQEDTAPDNDVNG